MLNKLLLPLLMFICAIHTSTSANAESAMQDKYVFSNNQQQQQFYSLLGQLRCVVCQNQSLSDSDAPLAVDLRALIYEQQREGKSEQQILDYLQNRYGDFVLFSPPLQETTLLLWLGPFLFLLIGIIFWLRNFFSSRERNKSLGDNNQYE